MDERIIVPYRTISGLEIGKNYQPKSMIDWNLDIADIRDQEKIQEAYIADFSAMKKEKIDAAITAIALIAALAFIVF